VTLLGLSLGQLATLFGALGAGVVLLYILKLRRRQVMVPFSELWSRVFVDKESTAWFKRLKRLLSLLLQLLFLFLVTAALGDPRLSSRVLSGRHIVVLLDASASMQATDGASGTRMATALARCRELVSGKSGADLMMLVRMDHQVMPLTPFESDEQALLESLEGLQAADTRADLLRGLRFAADALRGRQRPLLVLVSDGAFPKDVLSQVSWGGAGARGAGASLDRVDLQGIEVRHVDVGGGGDNLGIVAFNARRYPRNKLSFELFLEVVNYRPQDARADLQLYADGRLIEVQRLALKAGQRTRFVCDPGDDRQTSWCRLAASGELIEARLAAAGGKARLDALPVDDRAFALLPRQRKQRVLLVTEGNLYLEGAMLLDEGLEVTSIRPADYSAGRARAADAVVFDRFFPEKPPQRSYLVVRPPAEGGPFEVSGTAPDPPITEHSRSHPVMRWVTLKDVHMHSSLVFRRTPGVAVLASSFRQPLMVARQGELYKSVAIGFDLTRSDLPLRVAFPLLLINTLDWFAGQSQGLVTSFRSGETWSAQLDGRPRLATVRDPGGQTFEVPVRGGRVVFSGARAGVYRVSAGAQRLAVAVNLADSQESRILPARPLRLGGRTLEPPAGFGISLKREIWIYLLLAALGLSLTEWLTYNRRVTV
jgi:hypothetical protein